MPPEGASWFDVLSRMEEEARDRLIREIAAELDEEVGSELLKTVSTAWELHARREQFPPEGFWTVWLIRTGRGWGKTRTGGEWLRREHQKNPMTDGIIARTETDLERYCLRGESGILSTAPEHYRPEYQPGKQRLVWPDGSLTLLFHSFAPDSIRGPNLSRVWADELASWKYPEECWDNMEFSLRAGNSPKVVVTTTPRPIPLIRKLERDRNVVLTTGHMNENMANLAPSFIKRMQERYEGTRKGRQELAGEVLDEAEGALWKREWFDRPGMRIAKLPCRVKRVVVAIDPPASNTVESAEAGIVVVAAGEDGRGYVLADLSRRATAQEWARTALYAYQDWNANLIVAERNNGGEMVTMTVRTVEKDLKAEGVLDDLPVSLRTVWASRGKAARAEPISALYEQGRFSHVGQFPELEDQLTGWEPDSGDRSPDRLDALVWGATALFRKIIARPTHPGRAETVELLQSAANWSRDSLLGGARP